MRNQIHYIQDQITLAVYHKRPQIDIELLLKRLEETIRIAKRREELPMA